MQHLPTPKPSRRSICSLPLCYLTGALVQFAHAQASGAPAAKSGGLYSLLSMLSALAFFALLVGVVRPKTFTFLFKEKTTRKRVCGIFGAAMVGFAIVASAVEPKPVAPAQETAAKSAQTKAQSEASAAEQRAKAAEARAERAEKAAAVASANAFSKTGNPKAPRSKGQSASGKEAAQEAAAPKTRIANGGEELPSNVTVMNIPGVGSRQVGEVDNVEYAVLSAETVPRIGDTRADGVFYVLRVAAANSDKTTHDVTTMLMKLLDDQEREFDPSDQGGMALALSGDQSAESFSAQVQPGVTKQFTLVYDAPADASGLKLKIPAGGFGFGQDAVIKVPTASE